jgi:hypothetical protein
MRTARSNKRYATRVGLAVVAAALLFSACGNGSASPGVASVGSTTTTTRSAPASAGGGAGGGGAANAGHGALGGGPQAVIVMSGGNGADMLKYAECMRSHGVVDFPDPSSDGTILVDGTVSQSPQYPAADNTCRNLLPNGGVPKAAQQAQGIAQLLKLSVCMRAHGISDYPDPTSKGIQIPIRKGMPSDLDPNNPRLQSAEKACQHSRLANRAAESRPELAPGRARAMPRGALRSQAPTRR